MEPSNFSSFGIPVSLRLELEALSESSELESSLKSDEKDDDEDEELLSYDQRAKGRMGRQDCRTRPSQLLELPEGVVAHIGCFGFVQK